MAFIFDCKERQERFGVFSPHNLRFSKGPAWGARSRYPKVSGFVLKASEKLLKPDALGASFSSGLVFPAGRAGATQERCCGVAAALLCCCHKGLPHQARTTCQALSWARKEPDWGCVPAHCGTWSLLNRITALAVNSSSRAPRLSCRVVL